MVETCITIAWILKDADVRAKQFIDYGLGQENLMLEHAKADLRESGSDPDEDQAIQAWEQWLNGERYTFLIEVNVGRWGTDLRTMAEEVGLIELYRNDYARWSSTTHSMWHHVVSFNLQHCSNPIHGRHRIPVVPQQSSSPEFLFRAAEYMDLAFHVFDEATKTSVTDVSAIEFLSLAFQRISS